MNPLLVKAPNIVRSLYPKRIWSIPNTENNVFLTFDDGPIPEVTTWVLDLLKDFHAKATFFCIGENIERHPTIFKRIVDEGHSIGNHTFNHLNGWQTRTNDYIDNCDQIERLLNPVQDVKLFRPPYGRLTLKQSELLQKKGYKIYMWDVLSGDFSKKVSPDKCLQNVKKNVTPGSIVVFHDSLKAEKNLRYVLPKILEYITLQKCKCARI